MNRASRDENELLNAGLQSGRSAAEMSTLVCEPRKTIVLQKNRHMGVCLIAKPLLQLSCRAVRNE